MKQAILFPLSLLYGLAVSFRNRLYDLGILRGVAPGVPVIVVGNISAGGTGKTPFVIWLAGILSKRYRTAILSRGYLRSSSGFRWVQPDDDPALSGDEPLEIKRRLAHIPVAVDRNRSRGITRMLELPLPPQVILMDDGFQHRRVSPVFPVVLLDAGRPPWKDRLLPAGRLREPPGALSRTALAVITKIPHNWTKNDLSAYRQKLRLRDDQILIQASLQYAGLAHAMDGTIEIAPDSQDLKNSRVLLVAGIAHPLSLTRWLEGRVKSLDTILFPDHHRYREGDASKILSRIKQAGEVPDLLLTTGKDAVKLECFPSLRSLKWKVIRMDLALSDEDTEIITTKIQEYVQSNS